MRWGLVLVLAACGNGHGGALDAPTVCQANLEAMVDRACTNATDCVLEDSADCCGTVVIAIAASSASRFPSAEAMYEACLNCPPLGCMHAPRAEDGNTPNAGETIVAVCDGNRCKSKVGPAPMCAASGTCPAGPSCNGRCCAAGEHCEGGTCMCGSQPACPQGDMCAAPGPVGGDSCGSICCGITGPCPQ